MSAQYNLRTKKSLSANKKEKEAEKEKSMKNKLKCHSGDDNLGGCGGDKDDDSDEDDDEYETEYETEEDDEDDNHHEWNGRVLTRTGSISQEFADACFEDNLELAQYLYSLGKFDLTHLQVLDARGQCKTWVRNLKKRLRIKRCRKSRKKHQG